MKRYHNFDSAVIDQEYKNPLAELSHVVILGSGEFVAEIKERFLRDKKADRDLPASAAAQRGVTHPQPSHNLSFLT